MINMDATKMIDINCAEDDVKEIDVTLRQDGAVLWVNVDGICVLRICKIGKQLKINDMRSRN